MCFYEMMDLAISGTEAVVSAVRLAEEFTGRNKILKFAAVTTDV